MIARGYDRSVAWRSAQPFTTSTSSSRTPIAEPTIAIRDLSGAIKTWIDTAVYTYKNPTPFLKQLAGEKIHRAEAVEVYAIDGRRG